MAFRRDRAPCSSSHPLHLDANNLGFGSSLTSSLKFGHPPPEQCGLPMLDRQIIHVPPRPSNPVRHHRPPCMHPIWRRPPHPLVIAPQVTPPTSPHQRVSWPDIPTSRPIPLMVETHYLSAHSLYEDMGIYILRHSTDSFIPSPLRQGKCAFISTFLSGSTPTS